MLLCLALAACNAGDNTVDPHDLSLRDLLGLSPDVALTWTDVQRASARTILASALRTAPGPAAPASGPTAVGAVAGEPDAVAALASLDASLVRADRDPFAVVRIHTREGLEISPVEATRAATLLATDPQRAAPRITAPGVELSLADSWDASPAFVQLPDRGLPLLDALAADARAADPGPIVVAPASRLTVIAAYVARDGAATQLLVNPVALAALDPDPATGDAAAPARIAAASPSHIVLGAHVASSAPSLSPSPVEILPSGNPYSFYGSFEECAQAQRTRCESCLPSDTCQPVTTGITGHDECTQLADNAGRGYFLLCINLSLAIGSVERCTAGKVPDACPPVSDAAAHLSELDANDAFLDTPVCAGALDGCLADIFGAPDQPFPGPSGGSPPSSPPRTTNITCGNACDHDNANCTASPNIDCSGPSCSNTTSCDCHDDNDGGSCNSGSGSGGSCNSGSGGSCNSGSGSSGSGSSSSGGCHSCDSGSGGSCNSSGSGGSCNSCGSGSSDCSSGKCSTTPAPAGPALAVISLIWALLPIPIAARLRRRARRARSSPRGHAQHDLTRYRRYQRRRGGPAARRTRSCCDDRARWRRVCDCRSRGRRACYRGSDR